MIHPTAIVADSAVIADDVEIGPYTLIGEQVEIGAGCRIAGHVVVNGPTRLGRDNRIFQFASIGDDPQDKKYAGEPTRLEIGDGNTIREFVTISRGTTQDEGVTIIGNDNWIMAYVHIAHDCRIGSHAVFANNATLAGHVQVGDWVIMGGFSGVHQFCRLGAHAFLAMYCGTGQDVPAYTMVSGQPAAPRGVNVEGLKRRGFTTEQIRNVRNAYRVLYRQGLKRADALAALGELAATQPELAPFVDSIRESDRGIVR